MVTDVLVPLLPVGSVYLDRDKSLTPQIVDDLKVRIVSGQYPQGGPLPTNSALGDFYEVSDQVIVNVLLKLIVEGYVVKEGYGRYKVAAIIPPVKAVEPALSTLYCPVCGIWARLPEFVLDALPEALALFCATDKVSLVSVRLDPAKEVVR